MQVPPGEIVGCTGLYCMIRMIARRRVRWCTSDSTSAMKTRSSTCSKELDRGMMRSMSHSPHLKWGRDAVFGLVKRMRREEDGMRLHMYEHIDLQTLSPPKRTQA